MKQLCFDCMDRGFQGTRNIGGINALDALGDQLDLVFSGQKDIDTALKDAIVKASERNGNCEKNFISVALHIK